MPKRLLVVVLSTAAAVAVATTLAACDRKSEAAAGKGGGGGRTAATVPVTLAAVKTLRSPAPASKKPGSAGTPVARAWRPFEMWRRGIG